MKSLRRWIRDLFGFSANEINGFLILLPLATVLMLSEPAYRWWLVSQERTYSVSDQALDSAILTWKTRSDTVLKERRLFPFDPNTATEEQMVALGFDNHSTKRIAAYRQKGGVFRTKSDLQKIYDLDSTLYKQLYPYIALPVHYKATSANRLRHKKAALSENEAVEQQFNINTADTLLFKTVYGIGSRLAGRIVKFRSGLGGFVRLTQLYEVYGLDSAVVERLLRVSFISADFQPEKLNINKATEDELSHHPYIRRHLARQIVRYRFQHGDFHDANDIKKLWGLEDYELERLLPYLKLND